MLKIFKILAVAAGAAAAAGLAALAIRNPGTVAETSADAKDESLRPRHYKTDLQNFVAETEKLVPALSTYGKSWRLAASLLTENSALIKTEVPVLFFVDDLEIKAEREAANDAVVVNIHSNSRIGNSDFGENRRHLLQILRALDERFLNEN